MKLRIFLFALLFALPLAAQNQRFSAPFPSISSSTSTPFLVANVPPSSPVLAVCNVPANATPCTNYATTYNSAGVACSNGAQDTPDPQPSACQSTGDAQGNIGFFAPPGAYDYTVCVKNNCFGPYRVTVAAPVGGFSVVTGSLSSAQILSLSSSPVQVLPAPGAGLQYIVYSFEWNFIFKTTPYAFNNTIALTYGNGTIDPGIEASGTLNNGQAGLIGGANFYFRAERNVTTQVLTSISINAPLYINTGADPTTGDGAVNYRILYSIVPMK